MTTTTKDTLTAKQATLVADFKKYPTAHGLTVLRFPGGRFAEIEHSNGHASVLIADTGSPSAELFSAADAEFAKAKATFRRAMLYRSAAWLSLKSAEVSS